LDEIAISSKEEGIVKMIEYKILAATPKTMRYPPYRTKYSVAPEIERTIRWEKELEFQTFNMLVNRFPMLTNIRKGSSVYTDNGHKLPDYDATHVATGELIHIELETYLSGIQLHRHDLSITNIVAYAYDNTSVLKTLKEKSPSTVFINVKRDVYSTLNPTRALVLNPVHMPPKSNQRVNIFPRNNSISSDRYCIRCGVYLSLGDNWNMSYPSKSHHQCNRCRYPMPVIYNYATGELL
jgi:hypothetical protein